MRIRFHVIGLSRDRRMHEELCRAAAIHQEATDQILEREWRRRVRSNPKEIESIGRRMTDLVLADLVTEAPVLPMLLKRQAG